MTGKRRAFCLQNTYESVTVKSSRIAQSGNHSHDVIQSNEMQYFASCCTLEWKVLKTLEIWPKFDTSEILYICHSSKQYFQTLQGFHEAEV